MNRSRCGALVCALLLLLPVLASAQETSGSITGKVVDAQGLAIPGVTVTVVGPQGTKTAVTDRSGAFSVPFLTPGTYSVRVELKGFKTVERTNQIVSIGQTIDLPIKMVTGAIEESVKVVGEAPVIDKSGTTTGAVISSDLTASIPVGRRVSDVAYLAPGVSSGGTVGTANPSMAGGSGLDNLYVIDGVNVTNTGYGAIGSYSIIFGSLGQGTPFDFVKETQVKTGGYKAEFGQSTGGVLNVVTKSGTNSLQGSAFAYASPTETQSNFRHYETINGTVQTLNTSKSDGGAEGGFPIIRDRLFFFGAIDPQWETRTFQAPQGFPLESLGGVDRDRKTTAYSTKVTYTIRNGHQLVGSFFGDPSTGDLGPQRVSAMTATDTSRYSSLEFGGHNQTLRYEGVLNTKWLVEGSYAHALNRIVEAPSVDSWRLTNQTVTPNIISGGIGFYEKGNSSINHQWAASATNLLSRHQLKYGVQFDDVTYSQVNQRTGPTFVAADGRTTATGAEITILNDVNFGQIFRVTRANFNSGRTTTQKYLGLYVQDTWQVGSRLTVTPGLRYEQEQLSGTIVEGFSLKNNWAPRVGATFDPAGNGRMKIYGNYGRFFARVPNDLAARALSADDGMSRGDYFDSNLTRPIPEGVTTQTPGGVAVTQHFLVQGVGADTIDPSAKLSYVDEGVVGIEREVMRTVAVGVNYTYRRIGRVLEDVANAPVVAYDLGVPGLNSVEYILTNPSADTPVLQTAEFLGAKFDNPIHKYQAVEVTLNRRLSGHWTALASYRWSQLKGNFEGFYRDDNGQSDPGITSLYDFPTNDPSYTGIGTPQFGYSGDIRFLGAEGTLPLDRPHQVKVAGSYYWNFGLNVGMNMTLGSGKPLTPLAAHPNYTNGGEIPAGPRGSGIQTVDGFMERTPYQRQLDLQAAYKLKMGKNAHVTFLVNVFNVFNELRTLDYDAWTELQFGVPNPDFGKPISQVVAGPQFQNPRTINFGIRFGF